jgi:AcrR family transcriptional regulator
MITDMKAPTKYHSPLRQAQAAATAQRILEAVRTVLERGDEPTFALVADAAGCQERTVYRHFPTKEDLAAAFWDWQYSLVGPRDWSLGTEAQLLALIDRSFRSFDEHPELIKAMLHTRHGRAARLTENDQRRAMAERCVDDAVPGLDAERRRQAAAATQLLFSAAAWEVLRDYWDMDGETAAATACLALTAMLEGLRGSSTNRSTTTTSRRKT